MLQVESGELAEKEWWVCPLFQNEVSNSIYIQFRYLEGASHV